MSITKWPTLTYTTYIVCTKQSAVVVTRGVIACLVTTNVCDKVFSPGDGICGRMFFQAEQFVTFN